MPPREDLKWWRCADFSHGIVRSQQRSTISLDPLVGFGPDGSASSAVGCLASPVGALIPGWRPVRIVNQVPVHNNWTSGYRPADVTGKDFLTGTAILSPVIATYSKTTSNRAADGTADHVFTQHTNFYDAGNVGHYIGHNVWRSTFWTNSTTLGTTTTTQDNDNANNPGFITGTDARRVRGFMVTGYGAPWNNGTSDFNTTPAVDEPNPRWFVASSAGSGEIDVDPLLYPDSDLSTYSSMANDTPIPASFIAGDIAAYHAGRLIIGGAQGYGLYGKSHLFEGSVAQFDTQYSRPFEMSSKSGFPIHMDSVLLQDSQISKVAALSSVNANTLFIQMDTSGGYVIQGDLDRPQVTHLPGVPSVFGYAAIPVSTPKGVVITSKSGIYVWNQGATADLISQQIPGDFWISTDWEKQRRHGASKGKLGYSDPYVLVPNGYMCNTTNGSWWQLPIDTSSTAPYFHYETNSSGQVYAFSEYMDQSHSVSHTIFDPYSSPSGVTQFYQWISNGIASLTPDAADTVIREIEIELSGHGSVSVLVTVATVVYSHVFTVDETSVPIRMRAPASLHSTAFATNGNGSNAVTVTLQAVGGPSSSSPLPTVHSIGLGYQVRTRTGAA